VELTEQFGQGRVEFGKMKFNKNTLLRIHKPRSSK
jgi:hypothetical protein